MEPLSIVVGTIVILQDQIILIVTHLNCPPKISTLKPTLKDQGVISRALTSGVIIDELLWLGQNIVRLKLAVDLIYLGLWAFLL